MMMCIASADMFFYWGAIAEMGYVFTHSGQWYCFSDDADPVHIGDNLESLESFLYERGMTTDIFLYGKCFEAEGELPN